MLNKYYIYIDSYVTYKLYIPICQIQTERKSIKWSKGCNKGRDIKIDWRIKTNEIHKIGFEKRQKLKQLKKLKPKYNRLQKLLFTNVATKKKRFCFVFLVAKKSIYNRKTVNSYFLFILEPKKRKPVLISVLAFPCYIGNIQLRFETKIVVGNNEMHPLKPAGALETLHISNLIIVFPSQYCFQVNHYRTFFNIDQADYTSISWSEKMCSRITKLLIYTLLQNLIYTTDIDTVYRTQCGICK